MEVIHFEADGSDLTGAVTQTYREEKIKRGRETDLEVVVVLLPSSGGVQPNLGVAQGREEAGPCSQNQMGTFLEHRRQQTREAERERWSFKVK